MSLFSIEGQHFLCPLYHHPGRKLTPALVLLSWSRVACVPGERLHWFLLLAWDCHSSALNN